MGVMELLKNISILLGVAGILFGWIGFLIKKSNAHKLLEMQVKELEARLTNVEKAVESFEQDRHAIQEIKDDIRELKQSLSVVEKFILGVVNEKDVLNNVASR